MPGLCRRDRVSKREHSSGYVSAYLMIEHMCSLSTLNMYENRQAMKAVLWVAVC